MGEERRNDTFIFTDEAGHSENLTELEAMKKIRNGALLSQFDHVSIFMSFSAITYHKTGYKEIQTMHWSKKLAKLAVEKNYEALPAIPDLFYNACAKPFASVGEKLNRKEIEAWKAMLNEQKPDFLKAAIAAKPSIVHYLNEKNRTKRMEDTAKGNFNKPLSKRRMPSELRVQYSGDGFIYSFGTMADLRDMEIAFLKLPAVMKTQDRLMRLVNSKGILSDNFIFQLLRPARMEYLFRKNGDENNAIIAAKEKIPYLTKEICEYIAKKHPEASIETPKFLDKEAVLSFWHSCKDTLTDTQRRDYFLKFPETMLDFSMTSDIPIDEDVLTHAPSLFAGTDIADSYFRAHPSHILLMGAEYQTPERLLRDGVTINRKNYTYVKDAKMREKVKVALGIQASKPKEESC